MLQVSEDEFVRAVLGSLGTFPPYFLRLRERNRLGPRLVGSLPILPELGAERVATLQEQGTTVVDVRSVDDYARGHIAGSLANRLRPQFASWLGFAGALCDRYGRKPILVIGWLVGLPVPLLIIWAPTWTWVIVAKRAPGRRHCRIGSRGRDPDVRDAIVGVECVSSRKK